MESEGGRERGEGERKTGREGEGRREGGEGEHVHQISHGKSFDGSVAESCQYSRQCEPFRVILQILYPEMGGGD